MMMRTLIDKVNRAASDIRELNAAVSVAADDISGPAPASEGAELRKVGCLSEAIDDVFTAVSILRNSVNRLELDGPPASKAADVRSRGAFSLSTGGDVAKNIS